MRLISGKSTLLTFLVLFLFFAVSGTAASAALSVSLESAKYDDNADVSFSSVRPGENITLTFAVTGNASSLVKYYFYYNRTSSGYEAVSDSLTRYLDDGGKITKTFRVTSEQQGEFAYYVEVNGEKSNEIVQQITTSGWAGEQKDETDQITQSPPSSSSDSGGGGCSAGFGMVLPVMPVVFALPRKKR
jgi:hypothetical protein